ncbi:MAG: hypothetical protein J1F01_05940 [Oscillospiraceae bacterium]|nr:hypothetical protein [Oscillospiraceae bacterium]
MKKKTLFLLGTAAAAGIYSAVTGKGPFNRIRFKEQHERIANYMETHYPKAIYTPVEATENGYVTVIKRLGMPDIILYITCDEDGNYIFTETQTANA